MYWHQINELLPHQRVFENLKKDLVLKSHELRLLEERAKQTEHHQVEPQSLFTAEQLNSSGFFHYIFSYLIPTSLPSITFYELCLVL